MDDAQVKDLIGQMTRRGLTVATAESLTGGGLVARMVDVPGASHVVRGGACTYAVDTKASVLGVSRARLDQTGPVDEQVARQMAEGARVLFGAAIGLSTTGVAGPMVSLPAPFTLRARTSAGRSTGWCTWRGIEPACVPEPSTRLWRCCVMCSTPLVAASTTRLLCDEYDDTAGKCPASHLCGANARLPDERTRFRAYGGSAGAGRPRPR